MDFHHPYSRGLPPRSEEPALFIRPPPRATPHPPHLPYSLPPSSTPYAPMAYGPAAYNHHQAHSQSQPQQQGQQQQQQPHYQPPTAASFPPTSTAPLSVPPSISQPSAPLESNSYRFPPVNHGSGMTQNQNQHQNRGRGRSYSRSHSRSNSYSYSQNHSPRVAAWVNKTNAMFGEGREYQFLFCFVLFYCDCYLFCVCRALLRIGAQRLNWTPGMPRHRARPSRVCLPSSRLSVILRPVCLPCLPCLPCLFPSLAAAVTRQDRPPRDSSGALGPMRTSAG